jgi:hypothetical protein
MSKHTFTDRDGDKYTVTHVDDIPTLLDIIVNDGPDGSGDPSLTIRVDAAEDIARIILEAAKEVVK